MKMNKVKNIAVLLVAGLLSVACNKFLDKMPDNRTEIDNQDKIRALLASAYNSNTYLKFSEYMSDNVCYRNCQ